jgi:hypothetical protein
MKPPAAPYRTIALTGLFLDIQECPDIIKSRDKGTTGSHEKRPYLQHGS